MRRVLATVLLGGCAGLNVGTGAAPVGSSQVPTANASYAGTYETKVTLRQSNCGAVEIRDNATVVTYDKAASIITLAHAGTTYGGRISADGSFATQPKSLNIGAETNYVVGISGRFRSGGFDAEVTIDRSGRDGSCRYAVHWAGTRA